jgi:TPR repeat protein
MKAILRSGFLALAIMTLTVPANAGPLEDGLAAAERRDYAAALKFWLPLAEQGNAELQFTIGLIYNYGQGVPQDHAEAASWFRLAAEQGDAGAQENLGLMYEKGWGVQQDYLRALMWFNVAAMQGYGKAQKGRDFLARKMTRDQIAKA